VAIARDAGEVGVEEGKGAVAAGAAWVEAFARARLDAVAAETDGSAVFVEARMGIAVGIEAAGGGEIVRAGAAGAAIGAGADGVED
jgi:hypothetical protein